MVTTEQRTALLAVACPWCQAAPGEDCSVRRGRRRDTEGGVRKGQRAPLHSQVAHDSRWTAAGLPGVVPVNADWLAERRATDPHTRRTAERPAAAPQPALVGAERPW
jgi:hypothetical protein